MYVLIWSLLHSVHPGICQDHGTVAWILHPGIWFQAHSSTNIHVTLGLKVTGLGVPFTTTATVAKLKSLLFPLPFLSREGPIAAMV